MHNQNEEFFMTKKKKPSFAEWTLQNGITQKPASTTVGVGVPDDPHSRTNQQVKFPYIPSKDGKNNDHQTTNPRPVSRRVLFNG